jgi:hypothetical protein
VTWASTDIDKSLGPQKFATAITRGLDSLDGVNLFFPEESDMPTPRPTPEDDATVTTNGFQNTPVSESLIPYFSIEDVDTGSGSAKPPQIMKLQRPPIRFGNGFSEPNFHYPSKAVPEHELPQSPSFGTIEIPPEKASVLSLQSRQLAKSEPATNSVVPYILLVEDNEINMKVYPPQL